MCEKHFIALNSIFNLFSDRVNCIYPELPEIIADSPQMKEALRLVQHVASSDTSDLITRESGVGKELIAQAIHRLSNRSDKPKKYDLDVR